MGVFGRIRAWAGDTAHFLRERPVRLVVVTGALGVGALAGLPASNAAYNYTWRHPDFCDDCHVHDYANDAYMRSVHAGVTTCHDCHRVPIAHYPRNLYKMVVGRPQTPDDIHTPDVEAVLCASCHVGGEEAELTGPLTESLRARVVKIDHSPLHRLHLDSETRDPGPYRGGTHGDGGGDEHASDDHAPERSGIVCLDCHGSAGNEEAHRFTAVREACLECHGDADTSVGRMATLQCQECHFDRFTGEPGTAHAE